MLDCNKHKLLIIYQDSTKKKLTENLDSLFDIVYIPKLKRTNLKDFKWHGNSIASKYNDIFYSTNSEFIYIICSSSLNKSVINTLLNYKESDKDFDLFLPQKNNDFITLLSGLVIKKEVLIKIGFLEKHIFNDLYFNLVFNYSRFIGKVPLNPFSNYKMSWYNLLKYFYWNQFEKVYYMNNPVYSDDYIKLYNEFDYCFANNIIKKVLQFFVRKIMDRRHEKVKDIVNSVSFIEYW